MLACAAVAPAREPADQQEIVVVAGPERIVVEPERQPDAGAGAREIRTGRHDADDPAGNSVEPDLAGQDLRIGAEPGAPDAFADDDHRGGHLGGLLFVGREGPAHERRHAEHRKESVRHPGTADPHRLLVSREVGVVPGVGGEPLDRPHVAPVVLEFRLRDVPVRLLRAGNPRCRRDRGRAAARSSTPLTTLKIAALAPMPSARVSSTTAVKPGVRASPRRVRRRSWSRVLTVILSGRMARDAGLGAEGARRRR